MKIYTRQGDDGTTQLLDGGRVAKDALRLEVEGTLDELNAALGAAASRLGGDELVGLVRALQGKLLALGALIAGADDTDGSLSFSDEDVAAMETTIDELSEELPPLRSLVLPGGTPAGSHLHLARTICRRLERRLTSLAGAEPVPPLSQRFLNRLSDLLFMLARAVNHRGGVAELEWQPQAGDKPTPRG